MELDELINAAAASPFSRAEVLETARQCGVSVPELFDTIAMRVARGFLDGSYSWSMSDVVMNHVFSFAIVDSQEYVLGDSTMLIFEAFDQGEFHHIGEPEELQFEVKTRSLLARIPAMGLPDPGPVERELLLAHQAASRLRAAGVARDVIAGRLGPIVGAQALHRLRPSVGPVLQIDGDFEIFKRIDSRVRALPLEESVRALWAADALAEKDVEIGESNVGP